MNNGKTTQYFQLNKGVHQGNPISTYLFFWKWKSYLL